ncbi:MAG TPA: histidine kinase [Conexibacter sp.]|jgi:signal transduction histidine kinase
MAAADRTVRLPAWMLDLVIAVAAAGFALLITHVAADGQTTERSLDTLAYLLILVASTLLLWRSRWPQLALGGSLALDAVYLARGYPGGPGPCVVALVGLATLAARTPLRGALMLGGGVLVIELITLFAIAGEPVNSGKTLAGVVWVVVGTLIGITIRSQRASVAAVEARAREAERTRAEEARRQVGEERLRIARELHDVLAHSLAMIHVQASTGAHVVERRPEQAEQVLRAIKRASGEALADLRTTVGVLRAGGEQEPEPAGPQPSLARVEELVDGTRRAGTAVEIEVTGERRRLPVPVDVAGYRIVQEALTNVVRHAAARQVRVALAYEPDGVALVIDDDGRGAAVGAGVGVAVNGFVDGGGVGLGGGGPANGGDGHGLAGMRERAALLGGSVEAGPRPGGGFRVRARLPVGV